MPHHHQQWERRLTAGQSAGSIARDRSRATRYRPRFLHNTTGQSVC